MDQIKAYKFCPRCGGKLIFQQDNLIKCNSCGHNLYINPVPCNAVILENENREILLVKRKFPPQKGYWDLPGGFIQPDESLEESVKREIKEELNLDVAMTNIVGGYKDSYLYGGILYPTFVVTVASVVTGGNIKAADDISLYRYFPKDDVLSQKLAFKNLRQSLSDYLNRSYASSS